ncbi:DUF397 domain-containing protein [Streptomyces fuscichromogenes]|uniref:DUF397 domain-containing protein n=1 Tax=Streptomyces fuscichromogenes TaxID=1324013 RepID=A0A917XE82_9ACTN|nr:DUF397 domain-containing protein [Streptomyces fuscichromogenes]GGN14932.1 hypothetical protein GCM10011578_042810 [Streptomyces fuscichromogenes]
MSTRQWRTSSYCQEGEACVHISTTPTAIRLADADPPRTVLTIGPAAFGALLDLLKSSAGR